MIGKIRRWGLEVRRCGDAEVRRWGAELVVSMARNRMQMNGCKQKTEGVEMRVGSADRLNGK